MNTLDSRNCMRTTETYFANTLVLLSMVITTYKVFEMTDALELSKFKLILLRT